MILLYLRINNVVPVYYYMDLIMLSLYNYMFFSLFKLKSHENDINIHVTRFIHVHVHKLMLKDFISWPIYHVYTTTKCLFFICKEKSQLKGYLPEYC